MTPSLFHSATPFRQSILHNVRTRIAATEIADRHVIASFAGPREGVAQVRELRGSHVRMRARI